jgi:hypothetical protein
VYTPALNFNGPGVFTYTVSDGALTSTARVTVTVTPVNDGPAISALGDLTITVNSSTGPIPFTVSDPDPGDVLTVTAASGNPVLVPNASMVLGGSGINRTLTITPASGESSAAVIALTVSDGHGGPAQSSFVLYVVVAEYRLLLPVVMR